MDGRFVRGLRWCSGFEHEIGDDEERDDVDIRFVLGYGREDCLRVPACATERKCGLIINHAKDTSNSRFLGQRYLAPSNGENR